MCHQQSHWAWLTPNPHLYPLPKWSQQDNYPKSMLKYRRDLVGHNPWTMTTKSRFSICLKTKLPNIFSQQVISFYIWTKFNWLSIIALAERVRKRFLFYSWALGLLSHKIFSFTASITFFRRKSKINLFSQTVVSAIQQFPWKMFCLETRKIHSVSGTNYMYFKINCKG